MSNMHRQYQLLRAGTVLLFWLSSSVSPVAQSQAAGSSTMPRLVMYSGVVKDTSGKTLTGTVGVTFALYKEQESGSPLWLETQNVQADPRGRFSVYLGATKPDGLPQDLFVSGEARWLGVRPDGQGEQPRVQLITVPYAMKAGDAETVGGLPPSAFMLAAASASGASAQTPSSSSSSTPVAPPLAGAGTVNFVPLWTPDGNTLGNSILFQSGTGSTAKIGVNTNTPVSTLDVKGGGTIRGTLNLPTTGTATATSGKNSQVSLQTASSFNSGTNAAVSQNFRWQAEPTGNNTTTPSGTLNLLFSSGNNPPAETGLHVASNGQITFAAGQTFPGTGNGTITGVTAGTGLTGGGSSGSVTLNLDTTKVPQLNATNTFNANQTVNGNVNATGVVTGSVFQIGTNLFGFGSFGNQNAFLGFAGNTTMTGLANVATGPYALFSDTTGSSNTANGVVALNLNQTGSDNTAIGAFALAANTAGGENTAIGVNALVANSGSWSTATGSWNTATGGDALASNTTGSYNTASGDRALAISTTGSNNAAGGEDALSNNTTGSNNTGMGAEAGTTRDTSGVTGNYNTFLGAFSRPFTGTLTNATAIGAQAEVDVSNALVLGSISGVNAATTSTNVGIGTTSPAFTLDVHGNANFTGPITFATGQTFPGTGTITGVTAGTDLQGGGNSGTVTLNVDTTKVVTGVVAGNGLTGGGTGGAPTLAIDTSKIPQLAAINTFTASQTINGTLSATGVVSGSSFQIGSNLFAFGSYANASAFLGFAGNGTSTGYGNTATGPFALYSNSAGNYNVAVGEQALESNDTGSYNTASGTAALFSNVGGNFNTAAGYQALLNNHTGSDNTADGEGALFLNMTGSYNTGIGLGALGNNEAGNNNTAAGYSALFSFSSGNNNAALGSNAGMPTNPNSSWAGSNNTFLGAQTTPGAQTNLNNATAIGAHAEVDTSNALVLGSINGVNSASADTRVGIGTTTPIARLHIGVIKDGTIGMRIEGPATSGTGAYALSIGGQGEFNIDANGVTGGRFTVKENGRVGIGTYSPDMLLSVNGNADKAGGGSWAVFSDRRLKSVDGSFSPGLSQVLKINPIRYRYKKDNALGLPSDEEHIGVVAQQILQVIPEAVTENSRGYLLVNNDPIIWAMLNAIKEQQRQIRNEEKRVKAQQAEVSSLRAQLRQQEARSAALASRLVNLERKTAETPRIALSQKSTPPPKTLDQ